MKKFHLTLTSTMLSAVLLTACSSEEKTVQQESVKTVEFNKSAEMLNFESALKDWMQAKRETASGNETNKQAETVIARDAQALLTSIGVNPSEIGKSATTDELVRFTMKAYSKKLTEIYQQQIK